MEDKIANLKLKVAALVGQRAAYLACPMELEQQEYDKLFARYHDCGEEVGKAVLYACDLMSKES